VDRETRNTIERATQRARYLLEEDFASQLEGTFDVMRGGLVAPHAGAHLSAKQAYQREKIVAAIEHKRASGMAASEAVVDYLRDAAFTAFNRFVALKMLEARGLVLECISKGEQSSGYREFGGMAPGVGLLPEGAGYRLYIESLFDELSTEVKILFDRRDPASVLWPKRPTFDALLEVLNVAELRGVWGEDETIGWVYQFFNSGEERKRMREESQAPRNSRELAVRNQFFTPRYVVEFLVDNTLGRTWIEMHGASSSLSTLCYHLVRSDDARHRARPRKDPRDLRLLDPACGSGHFLLYCFDLLLTIYEEAWIADTVGLCSQATGRTLRDDYPDMAALRRAMPALIIEYNLYGVDIDPRAAQIAPLALWLRAQRAWKDTGVTASERPPVRRTHVVVAEPMPGDTTLVDEFAVQLEPPLLRVLFRKLVSEMRLAGELGALIPVEQAIAAELRKAREQFARQTLVTGFLPGMEPVQEQGELDISGIDDDSFFHEAEARIVGALRQFAEVAIGGAQTRRRLFAGDSAQGIALIDLLRTRFDVVLMNPPFGAASLAAKKEFERAYPRTKNDIYAAFVERGIELLHPRGMLGSITSRAAFFLSSFKQFREEIVLKDAPPTVFADLGLGVMDSAIVEAAAYCLENGYDARDSRTVFLRVLEEVRDKESALATLIRSVGKSANRRVFQVSLESLSYVPGSPFAYWATDRVRQLFQVLPSLAKTGYLAQVGASTKSDARFLRAWWEVRAGSLWKPFAKGGARSAYYSDIHLMIKWGQSPREIDAFICERYPYLNGNSGWVLHPESAYFHPGLTWTRRTKSELSLRVMPAGCVFSDKGPAVFASEGGELNLESLLAIANSKAFRSLVDVQLAAAEPTGRGGVARSYEVGLVSRTPIPQLSSGSGGKEGQLALRAWSLKRSLDTHVEASHAFSLPAVLQEQGESISVRTAAWSERIRRTETEIMSIQNELDERCFDLYGIDGADRNAVIDGFVPAATGPDSSVDDDPEEEGGDESGLDDVPADLQRAAADLVSWAIGVAFGRFDVRIAMGARQVPHEPDPFSQLPACSPGMLSDADGHSSTCAPGGYPVQFPDGGVLVDDLGHSRDLVARVRLVFDLIFGATSDNWWTEVAILLDPKSHDLRVWLRDAYFEYHLKRHSKSRRKAPVFWHLGTPSGRFGVWLYAHRLTRDTFFQLQQEVVAAKLAHEERQLALQGQTAGGSPTNSERREIASQETTVEELRGMLEEVKRVAPLWNPNLDDGVMLTMAPLWRLVPQHRSWQKELKSHWDELVAGKHEWTHVAMHLWPERVVPKCASDRSLALAHGLEDVFWVESADGKWTPRDVPTRSVAGIVAERSSAAVKAARDGLLAVPSAKSATTSGRRRVTK
jgi:hypothetical protein